MNEAFDMEAVIERPARFAWKPMLALFLPGVFGAAVLYALAPAAISSVDILLLAIAVVTGVHLTGRVGLCSFVADKATFGTPALPRLRPQVILSIAAGLAAALLITTLDFAFLPLMGADAQAAGQAYSVPQLILGVTYGGVTEELLLRWGLMTLLVWLAWRVARGSGSSPSNPIMWFGIALSAILFGAAHLPALAAAGQLTAVIVTRTILLNAIAGGVYGWLFWRQSLESAMLAHALTHVGFFIFIPLISAVLR